MSQQDLQFIERALTHPWMFWVYFWKWPRIVRQACAEYDMLAKERDAAKAAHERSERANKIVRDWIHVTHRLSTTPEAIRAIFAAGKRLSILLVFFVVTNTYGQAPPYLRNQWTTNANPLALKVISTNGVHAATNVWELDFTNTATVTVSAVSNANKVMVSFTGSASGGGFTNDIWVHTNLGTGFGTTLYAKGSNNPIIINSDGPLPLLGAATNGALMIFQSMGTNTLYVHNQGGLTFGRGAESWWGGIGGGSGETILSIHDVDSGDSGFNQVLLKAIGAGGTPDLGVDMDLNTSGGLNSFVYIKPTWSFGGVTKHWEMRSSGVSAFQYNRNGVLLVTWGPEAAATGISLTPAYLLDTFEFHTNNTAQGLFGLRNHQTNIFIVHPNGAIYSKFLTPSTVLWFNASSNIASIANGAGALTNDGAGVVGWKPLSDFGGGSGIASVFTNNALAGGPGLTELGFTNTATVTWAATTNAGRVTMSATSAGGGSGIATNDGTGFGTTFYGLTNFGKITFTNGARIEQPTATITRFTNSTFDFGGNMTFTPNGTYQIGADGASSPALIYSGNGIVTENYLFGRNKGGFYWIGDGVIRITDNAGTSFGRLQFGGTGATHPALKRSAGHLTVVDAAGNNSTNSLFFGNTVDTTASTGMTMNRQTGRVRLSAGNQTYLVTNNLATTSSIVTATVNSDDANALSVKAIPTAGLITLKVNAATAANTDISFFISSP